MCHGLLTNNFCHIILLSDQSTVKAITLMEHPQRLLWTKVTTLALPNYCDFVVGSSNSSIVEWVPWKVLLCCLKTSWGLNFILDNQFPGQSKYKLGVYFKMLLGLPRGVVQLVKQMQSREDMENSWFIFYHLYTMVFMVVRVYEKRTHL